jgi:peptidoglycan/LPS O-acetylase OafA/YrhL
MGEASGASRADQFNAGLTGIRGLAAMMVLLHHVFALAGPRTVCQLSDAVSRHRKRHSVFMAFAIQLWTMRLLDHLYISGDRLGWLVAISIPLSLLVATLSYYLIERPFMARRASAFFDQRRQPSGIHRLRGRV